VGRPMTTESYSWLVIHSGLGIPSFCDCCSKTWHVHMPSAWYSNARADWRYVCDSCLRHLNMEKELRLAGYVRQ